MGTRIILVGFAGVLLVAGAAVRVWAQEKDQDQAELKQRMQQAIEATSLDLSGTKPWHLKLSVVKNPDDLTQVEETTIEEWWAAPNLWRRTYTTATGSYADLHTDEGLFRTKDAKRVSPEARALFQQVVHPLPRIESLDQLHFSSRTETVGGRTMDCVSTTRLLAPVQAKQGPNLPPTSVLTYCFEPGRPMLRVTRLPWDAVLVGTSMGKFQDRSVPIALTQQGPRGKLEAKVVQLTTQDLTAADFPIGDQMEKVSDRIGLSGGVVTGRKIKGSNPQYPLEAKMNHISGTVVLSAVIGTDGKIGSLELLSSPDPALTKASMKAVSDWEYTPYLMNGKPVEIETTITVNFNIGP